ncbi:glycosyltransferase family 39 protein [Clostridium gasigenes]|uniref:glycosyltransferase family 39 protein n=1 Tax=Clostridium gasigenes TaxID=94869 RepID=UPI00209B5A9E|nr:glycosyltransferase family 39 protein [Clostridium gasigenes]
MGKFSKYLNWSLRILFFIVIIGSVVAFGVITYLNWGKNNSIISIGFYISAIILIFSVYYTLKNKYKKSLIIISIMMIALALRLLWFYSIDSIPVGDFNRMFICAGEFLNSTTYMFEGTAYFARFPHMSITVLYFALIRDVFRNSLEAIRFINIIFSMFNVIILFFISKEIFNDEEKSIWVLFISAIYPPMIIYNNVYCSENMAIPLLLLSILMFLKSFNNNNRSKNKLLFILASGVSLSATQIFRPIGYVMIIAYIMYVFIYFREKIRIKIIMNVLLIVSFAIPLAIVSYTLIGLNITENHLWRGTEPPSVSMLKGSNIKSVGRWNQEDSEVFDKYNGDYEKVDIAAKEIIKERLIETPKIDLLKFYTFKYGRQWSIGDFGGAFWAENGLDEAYNKEEYLNMIGKNEGRMLIRLSVEGGGYIQISYLIILVLSYIGLYKNKKDRNYKIDLLYIIFGGVSLQCLITESQDRYAYPFAWIFIILAMTAFSRSKASLNINMNGEENERL